MDKPEYTIIDLLKLIIISVASLAFLLSVAVKLFGKSSDIGNVSTVFLGASSLVLGASSLAGYFKGKK